MGKRNANNEHDWTEADLNIIRRDWVLRSARQIGDEIGVSRCSVISKAHRIGMPSKESPIIRDPSHARAVPKGHHIKRAGAVTLPPMPQPLSQRPPPAPPLPPPSARPYAFAQTTRHSLLGATLAPLEALAVPIPIPLLPAAAEPSDKPVYVMKARPCCWPLGNPGAADFRFCEAPVEPLKPYCADHCKIAYPSWRPQQNAA